MILPEKTLKMKKLFAGLAVAVLLTILTSIALLNEGKAESDELTILMKQALSEEIYNAIAEGRYDISVPLLKVYSSRGNAEADFLLGNSYYYGTGVEEDIAKALEYYDASARAGYFQAQGELGMIYFNAGHYDEAYPLLLIASQRGMRVTALRLSHMFSEGLGVPKDARAAQCWARMAAKIVDGKRVSC